MTLSEEQKLIQDKRRNSVLVLSIKGMLQQDIATSLNISRETVIRDIRAKRAELKKEFKSIDNVISELSAAKMSIISDLYKCYLQSTDIKERTHILNSVWSIYHDFAKVLRPDITYQQNNMKIDNLIVVKWEDGNNDKLRSSSISTSIPLIESADTVDAGGN